MLRKVWLITLALLMLGVSQAVAAPTDVTMEGGVENEYDYKEYFYLDGVPDGVPTLLTGTVKSTVSTGKNGDFTAKYTYTLNNADKTVKLTRSLTYKGQIKGQGTTQKVSVSDIDKFSEKVTMPGGTLTLKDYQFSKSLLTDIQPSAEYFSGNWQGRKIYEAGDGSRLTVEITGETVGYDQFWSAGETQRMVHYFSYDDAADERDWSGTVRTTVSLTSAKELSYVQNDPYLISFTGGYLIREKGDRVVRQEFDMPAWDDDAISGRNIGAPVEIHLVTNPLHQRLLIPAYRDVPGHWAQKPIEALAGFGAWDAKGEYFGPNYPMNRLEFAKALAKVTGMVDDNAITKPGTARTARTASQAKETSPFYDIPASDPDYPYIKAVYDRDVMKGIGNGLFGAKANLTREQAVTMMVRALGLQNKAPTPGYTTPFTDDYAIGSWAKDSVYVANEVGLVSGNPNGAFRPQQEVTRAEAASMLYRMIEFMRKDIREDFRDRMLNR